VKIIDLNRTIDPSKRDEIISAAQKVFSDVGFEGATIRQICKNAKANVCLISYYFGGKDGLYKAIFEKIARDRADRVTAFFAEHSEITTAERFGEILSLFLERTYVEIQSKPEFFRIMNREVQDGMPRAADVIRRVHEEVMGHFVSFLEAGQKRKFVRRDLDAKLMASGVMNMYVGFMNMQILNKAEYFFKGIPHKEINHQIVKTVTSMFCEGVLT
jgi:AcrR family transcriptional regulator